MIKQVNIHEAKTHLSQILQEVEGGQEIIISRSGQPVARLVPATKKKHRRLPGSAKGKVHISPDFDDPLSPEMLKSFYT